jgi:hypothetical protein
MVVMCKDYPRTVYVAIIRCSVLAFRGQVFERFLAVGVFVIVDIHTVCFVTCIYQEDDMILHDIPMLRTSLSLTWSNR